jgi:hypothetical protein
MPKTQTIRCINKDDRDDPFTSITHVGGTNSDGSRWKQTQDQTIREIEAGEWQYSTNVNGRSVRVIVAVSRFNNKYLKTETDGRDENNLLSLPECP